MMDSVEKLDLNSNHFCDKLVHHCFEDVKKVIRRDDFNAFLPSFSPLTNDECEKETVQYYQYAFLNIYVHPCSYIDKTGKIINFFFAEVRNDLDNYIILFKRDDNELKPTDIKLFALTRDKYLLSLIFKFNFFV